MTSINTVTSRLALLGFVCGAFTLLQGSAGAQVSIATPPPTVQGGGTLVVTGTSSGGERGSIVSVSDDDGALNHTVSWSGNAFTITIDVPEYDANNPQNAVEVIVTAGPDDADTGSSTVVP